MKKGIKKAVKKVMGLAESTKQSYNISFGPDSISVLFLDGPQTVAFYYWALFVGEFYNDKPEYYSDMEEFLNAIDLYATRSQNE